MNITKDLVKTCKFCNQTKNINMYHIQKTGFLGRNSVCKDCRKIKRKKIICNQKVGLIMCNKCGLRKDQSDFYKNNSSKNGLQSYCKKCQKENISESKSKLGNFCKTVLKKFKKKNKGKRINLKVVDLIRKYNQQNGKCYITNHLMTHKTDLKQRTDNIWNLAICCSSSNNIINYDDFDLGVHLIYTMRQVYKLEDSKIKEIYQNLANN